MQVRTAAWVVASLLTGLALSLWHAAVTIDHLSIEALTEFRAPEPFQYRILLPALARIATTILSVPPLAAYLVLEALCWAGVLILARRALVEIALVEPGLARWISWTVMWPLAAHLMKPQYFRPLDDEGRAVAFETIWRDPVTLSGVPNLYYPYDVPAAMFAFWLFLLIRRLAGDFRPRTLAVYLAVFAVATANRESSILILPVFLGALWGRLPASRLGLAAAAQVILAIGVQGVIRALVADSVVPNPQSSWGYEWHAKTNLATLLIPACFVSAVPLFAGGLYLPLVRRLGTLSRWQVQALVLYAGPVIVLGFCFGQVLEARVFVEAVPVIWLVSVGALSSGGGRRDPNRGHG